VFFERGDLSRSRKCGPAPVHEPARLAIKRGKKDLFFNDKIVSNPAKKKD